LTSNSLGPNWPLQQRWPGSLLCLSGSSLSHPLLSCPIPYSHILTVSLSLPSCITHFYSCDPLGWVPITPGRQEKLLPTTLSTPLHLQPYCHKLPPETLDQICSFLHGNLRCFSLPSGGMWISGPDIPCPPWGPSLLLSTTVSSRSPGLPSQHIAPIFLWAFASVVPSVQNTIPFSFSH
jgi:hypothetical protein